MTDDDKKEKTEDSSLTLSLPSLTIVPLDGFITSIPMKDGKPDFRANHGCCRDFPCLIIFAACIIAEIVLFGIGFTQGNPWNMVDPTNSLFAPPSIIILIRILK